MQTFKKGDKIRAIQTVGKLVDNQVYTFVKYDEYGLAVLEEVNDEYYSWRFELVEPAKETPSFKIVEWKDWVNDTADRIEKAINNGNLSVFFVVTAPKLDKEDLNPFCEEYCCEGVYESNVFVKHHSEKNCYWYVTNDAKLIYNPKFN